MVHVDKSWKEIATSSHGGAYTNKDETLILTWTWNGLGCVWNLYRMPSGEEIKPESESESVSVSNNALLNH